MVESPKKFQRFLFRGSFFTRLLLHYYYTRISLTCQSLDVKRRKLTFTVVGTWVAVWAKITALARSKAQAATGKEQFVRFAERAKAIVCPALKVGCRISVAVAVGGGDSTDCGGGGERGEGSKGEEGEKFHVSGSLKSAGLTNRVTMGGQFRSRMEEVRSTVLYPFFALVIL